MFRPIRSTALLLALGMTVLAGCAEQGAAPGRAGDKLATAARQDADEFLVVDCLLPSQVRKLGRQASYLAPRRPIKTSVGDCEIRGGEYVSYDRADLGTALKVWLADAQAGDPKAQTYVGEIFERGVGGAADPAAAASWYTRAADQGYEPAMINLGQLYEQGRGVPKDEIKALNYYRRASGLGVAFVASEDTAQEIAGLQQQVSERDRELETLRGDVAGLETQLAAERRKRQTAAAAAGEREAALAAAQRDLEQRRAALDTQQQALPPDAAELVAERRQLERKARALTEVEKSLAAWRAQLEAQEERIGGAKQAQADRGQLEAELAAARLELERARSALSEAQAAQAAATASDDAEDDAEEERLARLESTLAAWETTLNDREAQLAARESAATADRQTRSRDEQQRVEAARRELERAQTDLATQQDTLARREAQLAEKERALAEADQALQARLASIAESESALQEQTVKLADQEAAYRQRQAELAALDRQIAELDANAAKKMAALAVFADPGAGPAAAPTVADDGPQITMIDPPLEVRSSGRRRSIQVRSNVAERQIIGRIDSSVPMLSLVVNDNPVEVSDSGVFRTAVPIDRDELPVLIVAVDERGRRKEIDFVVEREIAAAVQQIATTPGTDNSILPPMSRPPIDLGRFHALVIGNNAYTKLPPLETARNDASAVAEVLESRYGFEVTLLLDATRYDILSAMNKLRASLTENDNLLIYYAGHGELDEVNQRGHWLPVDAEPDSTANWISNVQLTDILNAMAAERIIIIADSCYSGSLTRSSLARLDAGMTLEARNAWIEALADKKARMALTSGGLAPVLDAGGGDNSIFARSLIDALSSNNDVLEGQRLYQQVAARVTYAAEAFAFEQVPQYAPIKFAGHESGEFFFVPKS